VNFFGICYAGGKAEKEIINKWESYKENLED
jgi:hypothetical protein